MSVPCCIRLPALLCSVGAALLFVSAGGNAVNFKALDATQKLQGHARAREQQADLVLRSRIADDVIIEAQANDTIPISYWSEIDGAIAAADATTPAPATSEAEAVPEPWQQVFEASGPHDASGSVAITADALTPGEIAKMPDEVLSTVGGRPVDVQAAAEAINTHTVLVPYDMQLGARLMYTLSSKGTTTPPPTQQVVSEQLVAQCPMVMFTNSMGISAPRCGEKLGEWFELGSERNVLRWEPDNAGGVRFGVDSVVTGKGSVTYGTFEEEFSLKGNHFRLLNCLEFMRWTVEEEVVKMHHTGHGVRSSIQEHDVSKNAVGFFYRYTIRAANGSAVAQTDLFRKGYHQVNVTLLGDEISSGPLIATATKVGSWSQEGWRECSPTRRMWQLEFFLSDRANEIQTVATVADLRVAAAAMITLMAFRDEATSDVDGLNHRGETGMITQLGIAALIVVLAVALCCGFTTIVKAKRWDARMRRHCFKLEAICLPKRPAWQRKPSLGTTY